MVEGSAQSEDFDLKTETGLVLVLLVDFVHKRMMEALGWDQIWKLCPEKQLSVNHLRKMPFALLDSCSRELCPCDPLAPRSQCSVGLGVSECCFM